jgi:hypothetical protein
MSEQEQTPQEKAKSAAARVDDWDGADHFDDCPSRAHESHDCACPETDEGEDACAELVETECDCYLGALRDCREAIRAVLDLVRVQYEANEEMTRRLTEAEAERDALRAKIGAALRIADQAFAPDHTTVEMAGVLR